MPTPRLTVSRFPFTTVPYLIAGWILLLTAAICHAWSAGGHKVVALIAYRQLDDQTRDRIVQILEQHPLWAEDFAKEMPAQIASGPASERQRWIFAQAAIWPDIARKHKTPPADYHRPTWHYINDAIYLDPQLARDFAGHLPLNLSFDWHPGVDAELQNAPQTIEMAKAMVADRSIDSARKAVALCWLFHVVGDLHQPLHCTTLISRQVFRRGDKGGNGIELRKTGQRNGRTLHAFWDGLLKANVSLNEASQSMVSILEEAAASNTTVTVGTNLALKDWVTEGKEAAQRSAYTPAILSAVRAAETTGDEGKVVVTMTGEEMAEYGRAAGAVASQRGAIAGFRLGGVLKSLFQD